MIWSKSSLHDRLSLWGSKMFRGSPVCPQMCEKITEVFKNNVPQRKIEGICIFLPLQSRISLKHSRNLEEFQCKGRGSKPELDTRDLWSLLQQHVLPSRPHLFQGRPCIFQPDDVKPQSAHITKAWLRKTRVLDWPACSPDPSTVGNDGELLSSQVCSLMC